MVRAAQIARQKLDDKLDVIVRKSLINFMAGRTAARLGASQEKNNVASLKI
jgi:hypothetical protein